MPKKIVIPKEQRKLEGAALKREWLNYQNRSGKNQAEVIAQLGVNQGQPSRWFNGSQQIPAAQLLGMAKMMGFDPKAIRPQIEAEMALWMESNQAEIDGALRERVQALDADLRQNFELHIQALEALQRSRR